jgi:hypothetical protein
MSPLKIVLSGKNFLDPPNNIQAIAFLIYSFPYMPGAIDFLIFSYNLGSLAIFLKSSSSFCEYWNDVLYLSLSIPVM